MAEQKKKLLPMAILAILREHTDTKNHIRQAPIMKLLQEEHHLTATRKSVRKNLGDLQEAGYPVKFRKGWYYEPLMTADELDYLRACVMGSDLRADKREDLLARLGTLGGPFYTPSPGTSPYLPLNPEFPIVMNTLNDAIAKGHVISFQCTGDAAGDSKKRYRASPYELAVKGGTSVLICRVDGEDGLSEIPVAEIMNVKILKPAVTPMETTQ